MHREGVRVMDIGKILIQREDGQVFCGTLEFSMVEWNEVLLWTAEVQPVDQTILIEFFYGTERAVAIQVIATQHQNLLVDSVLAKVCQRLKENSTS